MLFNRQFECKRIIKHFFKTKWLNLSNYLDLEKKKMERKKKGNFLILYDAVTPLTTLLVSEIKMAAKILLLKVSDVLQGFL